MIKKLKKIFQYNEKKQIEKINELVDKVNNGSGGGGGGEVPCIMFNAEDFEFPESGFAANEEYPITESGLNKIYSLIYSTNEKELTEYILHNTVNINIAFDAHNGIIGSFSGALLIDEVLCIRFSSILDPSFIEIILVIGDDNWIKLIPTYNFATNS